MPRRKKTRGELTGGGGIACFWIQEEFTCTLVFAPWAQAGCAASLGHYPGNTRVELKEGGGGHVFSDPGRIEEARVPPVDRHHPRLLSHSM